MASLNSQSSNHNKPIKLTQYSHGAGCGCKISPKTLEFILKSEIKSLDFPRLLVGSETKDDAAVYDLGNGTGIISTTDFFMPIVDDAVEFGRIAATNAISDVYAMGGTPIMAVAILGFPINKLPEFVARQIVEGGRIACNEASIPLAGGHSIDSLEPVFGLAVTGTINISDVKRNSTAIPGCKLYLTKPIGIGILTTAEKKGLIKAEDVGKATELMCKLNKVGIQLSLIDGVKAMTDVTGFGLLGHLLEMCEGSGVLGRLHFNAVPRLERVEDYINASCCPGGTTRNYDSYGFKVSGLNGAAITEIQKNLLCDPQTSGGLLIAVTAGPAEEEVLKLFRKEGLARSLCAPIGTLHPLNSPDSQIFVIVE